MDTSQVLSLIQTMPSIQSASVSPIPVPTGLHRDQAVVVISGTEVDTVNLKVKYNYMAYKKYYSNSIIYFAVVQNHTNWISISNLCYSSQNITITSPIATTVLVGSVIQFTINISIGYDSCIVKEYESVDNCSPGSLRTWSRSIDFE